MGGVHPVSGEPGVSWASGLGEGFPEEAGNLVGWWTLTLGSIWGAMAGSIVLLWTRMIDWFLAGLGEPILMEQQRTANFGAEMGHQGRGLPVWPMCRGLVSERLALALTFSHPWLREDDSKGRLVLVEAVVQLVVALLN